MEQKELGQITQELFQEKFKDFLESAQNLQKKVSEEEKLEAWDKFEEKWKSLPLTEMSKIKGRGEQWISAMNHDIASPWAAFSVMMFSEEARPENTASLIRHFCRVVKSFAGDLLEEETKSFFKVEEIARDAAAIFAAYNLTSGQMPKEIFPIEVKMNELQPWLSFFGNENDFARIFQNLFTNCRKALQKYPGPRTVEITFDKDLDQKELIFSVADSGPGIDPKLIDSLFNFGVGGFAEGKGIGLSVCKELVEKNHGMIEVHNRPEGGSEFIIRLEQK